MARQLRPERVHRAYIPRRSWRAMQQEVEAAAEAKEVYDASGAQPTKATVKQMTGT